LKLTSFQNYELVIVLVSFSHCQNYLKKQLKEEEVISVHGFRGFVWSMVGWLHCFVPELRQRSWQSKAAHNMADRKQKTGHEGTCDEFYLSRACPQ
jgi:hypothetical protein